MTSFVKENWWVLLPCVLGFGAVYLLLPQAGRRKPVWAGALAAVALVLGAVFLVRTGVSAIESLLFFAFAGLAILAGVMMITQSNPVHAALSFAMVVLATCGLFLLQAAPFLMAATIIIYAGAIVVTFLFVIMLAQQEGISNADQRSREPFLASLAGCVLVVSLLCVLQKTYHTSGMDSAIGALRTVAEAKDDAEVKRVLGDWAEAKVGNLTSPFVKQAMEDFQDDEVRAGLDNLNRAWVRMQLDPARQMEPLKQAARSLLAVIDTRRQQQGSLALNKTPGKDQTPGHFAPGKLPAGNVAALGKTLFTDYLIPVELAAMLLLVATIGAIVIAGRRSEELR